MMRVHVSHVKSCCDIQLNEFSVLLYVRMYIMYLLIIMVIDVAIVIKCLPKKTTTCFFTVRGVSMLAH